jgi:putative transposase
MSRAPRSMPAGFAYHVLNRAAGRLPVFAEQQDARRFVHALGEAVERTPTAGLLAWCLMPTHWHLVFHPSEDDVVQRLLHWLTLTQTKRHRAAHGTQGDGHLYQDRYRSFPIATDDHLLTVLRYVERNPVRAGLVASARDWPWSSAARGRAPGLTWPQLAASPVPRPPRWIAYVDHPLTAAEEADGLERLRTAAQRGMPFGPAPWTRTVAEQLNLTASVRPRGRPRRPGPAT